MTIYTKQEAQVILGVSPKSLDNYLKTGKLGKRFFSTSGKPVGYRITQKDIDDFIKPKPGKPSVKTQSVGKNVEVSW